MKFLILVAALVSTPLQAEDKERVVLVGDSTVASRSGWGDSFGEMLDPGVGFANHGRGGRSSKSYRDERWWKKALAENEEEPPLVLPITVAGSWTAKQLTVDSRYASSRGSPQIRKQPPGARIGACSVQRARR